MGRSPKCQVQPLQSDEPGVRQSGGSRGTSQREGPPAGLLTESCEKEDAVGLPPVSSLVDVDYSPLPRKPQRAKWLRTARSGRGPLKTERTPQLPAQGLEVLPSDVSEMLSQFPDYQFVTADGGPPDRTRRGFLDLYSGSFGVAPK